MKIFLEKLEKKMAEELQVEMMMLEKVDVLYDNKNSKILPEEEKVMADGTQYFDLIV